MLYSEMCPNKERYVPISNIVSDDGTTFVCICLHEERDDDDPDKYRHCFKSVTTFSCYDYDDKDLISLLNVITSTLFYNEYTK